MGNTAYKDQKISTFQRDRERSYKPFDKCTEILKL